MTSGRMTLEEAQQVVKNVSCRCDGRGVIPGPAGLTIECPDCDGRFISNEEFKLARRVIAEANLPKKQ